MEVLYADCAGLDVHKDSVVACACHTIDGNVRREVWTFKTTTADLMALSAWLSAQGCTHIGQLPPPVMGSDFAMSGLLKPGC